MARVFIDTNVLFPFSIMDLMLALTEDAIHEVIWSERLLGEWERVIVREHQRSPDAAAAIAETVREFFAESRVDEASYTGLLTAKRGLTVIDPDAYLCGLLDGMPAEIEATIRRLAGGKRRPPLNQPGGIPDALSNAGVPRFVEQLKPRFSNDFQSE